MNAMPKPWQLTLYLDDYRKQTFNFHRKWQAKFKLWCCDDGTLWDKTLVRKEPT